MTRAEAIAIARTFARMSQEPHSYLPKTRDDAEQWMPHEWVIEALQDAVLVRTDASLRTHAALEFAKAIMGRGANDSSDVIDYAFQLADLFVAKAREDHPCNA